jgi:hypothetical protein
MIARNVAEVGISAEYTRRVRSKTRWGPPPSPALTVGRRSLLSTRSAARAPHVNEARESAAAERSFGDAAAAQYVVRRERNSSDRHVQQPQTRRVERWTRAAGVASVGTDHGRSGSRARR